MLEKATKRRTAVASSFVGLALTISAGAQTDFNIEGARPQAVIASAGPTPPRLPWCDERESAATDSSPMLDTLAGVVGRFEPRDIAALLACVPAQPRQAGRPIDAMPFCYIHVFNDRGARTLEVVRTVDDTFIAVDAGAADPGGVELNRVRFTRIAENWPAYRGTAAESAAGVKPGASAELEKPYFPARTICDESTLGDRLGGGRWTVGGTQRDLAAETINIRLPTSYRPDTPAGLLVWISPTKSGAIPSCFEPALDEAGFICVGADDSGNTRQRSDRYQLALDAVENVSRTYLIDPARVYVTGMSGGGRISSDMLAGFPEVFAGAIPIVGIHIYKNVPIGTGQYWPAGYTKPRGEQFRLFRSRPMAAMTGEKDFNYAETVRACDMLKRDGVNARCFEYPDMAHTMPTAERFLDAFRWVDSAAREASDANQQKGADLLARAQEKFGTGAPSSKAHRDALISVTRDAPWSEASLNAAALLGG